MEKEYDKLKAEILESSGKEYYNSGLEAFEKQRYNSAGVLFFKAILSFVDLFILKSEGVSPSSHGSRFRITQERFGDIYDLLDKDFPYYQDSYVQILSKEIVEVIKEDAERMAEKSEVEL